MLDEGAPDATRRVVERRAGRVAGAAAYEPLYGPAAEIAVSVEAADDLELVQSLVEAVTQRAAEAGATTIHVAIQAGQEPLAAAVLGVPVIDGTATLRVGDADGSVLHTEPHGQRIPMTWDPAPSILKP